MKLKLAAVFLLGSIIFASCSKKQCPAYGQVDENPQSEIANV